MDAGGILAQLDDAVRLAHQLRQDDQIQQSSFQLVEKRVNQLRLDYETFRDAPPTVWYDIALRSFIGEALDLQAIVKSMKGARPRSETENLAVELLSRHKPDVKKVETFLARSPRNLGHPSILFGEGLGEMTLGILTPDAPFDPPEKRGLVAHEVAHVEPDVHTKIFSMKPDTPRRGEVLADLFALSSLGPAFAWAFCDYAQTSDDLGSRSHPPLSLRFAVARDALQAVWTSPELRDWIGRLLMAGGSALKSVPSTWLPDLALCRSDLRTSLNRLRVVKPDEPSVLSVRGRGNATGIASASLRANALCPG